ncbi:jumonji C domain-containing protein 5-like [Clavelina lepadiformis]|uniref:jumonji C domain-containing protein 5-like n=1 Tax=Clavelina lepadiformis TaxID=159417 RepID=UPI0040421096
MNAIKIRFILSYIIVVLFLSRAVESHDNLQGHMEPLGSAGSYFNVPLENEFPSTRTFFNNYVVPGIPLLMKGVLVDSTPVKQWNDSFFVSHPDSVEEVIVEKGKKEIRVKPKVKVPFRDFVTEYKSNDIYMVNEVPQFLRHDVELPEPLQCEAIEKDLIANVMWFSNGGTKSVLHADEYNNVICQYRGSKRVVLINMLTTDDDWDKEIIDKVGAYSGVDVDAVNYMKYPSLARTRYGIVDMSTGDCLFIPLLWYHQVNSFGNNLAINIWFVDAGSRHVDLTEERCGKFCSRPTLDQYRFEQENSDAASDYLDSSVVKGSQPPLSIKILLLLKEKKKISTEDVLKWIKDLRNDLRNPRDLSSRIIATMDINRNGVVDVEDYKRITKDEQTFLNIANEVDYALNKYIDVQPLALVREQKLKLTRLLVQRGLLTVEKASLFYGKKIMENERVLGATKSEL